MAKAPAKQSATAGYAKFMALTDAEKERVWASFNREIPVSELRPLTAAERRLHARGNVRPKAETDAQVVNVKLDRRLVRRADAYAKAQGLTRAQLVARSLTAVIDSAASAHRRNGTAGSSRPRKAS